MFVVGAPTRDFWSLAGVEGAPLRAAVDLVALDDKAALTADGLAVFFVGDELAATLGAAGRLIGRLRFGFGFVLSDGW